MKGMNGITDAHIFVWQKTHTHTGVRQSIGTTAELFPDSVFFWFIFTKNFLLLNMSTCPPSFSSLLDFSLYGVTVNNWATSWETLFMPYANNKGADQPVYPRSLISTFVFAN